MHSARDSKRVWRRIMLCGLRVRCAAGRVEHAAQGRLGECHFYRGSIAKQPSRLRIWDTDLNILMKNDESHASARQDFWTLIFSDLHWAVWMQDEEYRAGAGSVGAMPTALRGHVCDRVRPETSRRRWRCFPCPRKAVGMAPMAADLAQPVDSLVGSSCLVRERLLQPLHPVVEFLLANHGQVPFEQVALLGPNSLQLLSAI